MRATSFSMTFEPSLFTRSRIAPNCAGVVSRLDAEMVAFNAWVFVDGEPPIWPTESCTFWFVIAVVTSLVVSPTACNLTGSSQMRMACCAPNSVTSPTPSICVSGSSICVAMMLPRSMELMLPSLDESDTIIRNELAALATCTPCSCTVSGSDEVACSTLFCTCT